MRHQFEISNVNFCLTSILSDVKKEEFFFRFFFRQSVYFYLKRRESEKKVLTKKFSPEVSKELRKIFFKSGSIPIMSFHNFCCWSCKFSNVKHKWTFYTLNWWRNPPCQFYLSFSKIGSRFLCENLSATSPNNKNSPCTHLVHNFLKMNFFRTFCWVFRTFSLVSVTFYGLTSTRSSIEAI